MRAAAQNGRVETRRLPAGRLRSRLRTPVHRRLCPPTQFRRTTGEVRVAIGRRPRRRDVGTGATHVCRNPAGDGPVGGVPRVRTGCVPLNGGVVDRRCIGLPPPAPSMTCPFAVMIPPMRSSKMYGIGNDYVYVSGFAETVADP